MTQLERVHQVRSRSIERADRMLERVSERVREVVETAVAHVRGRSTPEEEQREVQDPGAFR